MPSRLCWTWSTRSDFEYRQLIGRLIVERPRVEVVVDVRSPRRGAPVDAYRGPVIVDQVEGHVVPPGSRLDPARDDVDAELRRTLRDHAHSVVVTVRIRRARVPLGEEHDALAPVERGDGQLQLRRFPAHRRFGDHDLRKMYFNSGRMNQME